MGHFLMVFSPETYEAFSRSDCRVAGFRERHRGGASKVRPGDKLLCYMTKLSRWVGLLKVKSESFVDDKPIFQPENDPFVLRFKVEPVVWLPKEKALPIKEEHIWSKLSFTKHHAPGSSRWTGRLRTNLVEFDPDDASFLEQQLRGQLDEGITYPVDEATYQRLLLS